MAADETFSPKDAHAVGTEWIVHFTRTFGEGRDQNEDTIMWIDKQKYIPMHGEIDTRACACNPVRSLGGQVTVQIRSKLRRSMRSSNATNMLKRKPVSKQRGLTLPSGELWLSTS